MVSHIFFHNIWNNPSHWLSYFSRWLKPPTRSLLTIINHRISIHSPYINHYSTTWPVTFFWPFFSTAPSGKSLPGGFPGTGSRRSWGLPWQLGRSHAGPRQNDAKLEKQLGKLQKTDQMINNFSFFMFLLVFVFLLILNSVLIICFILIILANVNFLCWSWSLNNMETIISSTNQFNYSFCPDLSQVVMVGQYSICALK